MYIGLPAKAAGRWYEIPLLSLNAGRRTMGVQRRETRQENRLYPRDVRVCSVLSDDTQTTRYI